MKNILVLLLSLSFSIIACSDHSDDPAEIDGVNIRLRNTSKFDYTVVYVNTGGGEVTYGNVNSNDVTEYHKFDAAYRYALVQLEINGNVHKLQPIDFVGEKELENGYYTYEINAKADGGEYNRLTLNFIED